MLTIAEGSSQAPTTRMQVPHGARGAGQGAKVGLATPPRPPLIAVYDKSGAQDLAQGPIERFLIYVHLLTVLAVKTLNR
mgnify:CR=1 FL=1